MVGVGAKACSAVSWRSKVPMVVFKTVVERWVSTCMPICKNALAMRWDRPRSLPAMLMAACASVMVGVVAAGLASGLLRQRLPSSRLEAWRRLRRAGVVMQQVKNPKSAILVGCP